VPILGGLLVLATGSDRNAGLARCSPWRSPWPVSSSPCRSTSASTTTSAMQFVELRQWIPRFNIHYHLGVDGISVLFILLNSFITIMVVLAGWEVIEEKVAQYMAAFLIMSGLMNGIFSALDAVLFYVFFEASLIPMYLIIGIWGGPNRVYAAFKFFLYTLLGSLLMLVALIYLFFQSRQLQLLDWHQLPIR
jgi:NADH-quinone oxidoreductase subunit M